MSLAELSVPMLVGAPTSDEHSEAATERQRWDRALVEQARAGDRAAFGELLERHLPAARRMARAAVSQGADADEAVQDASVAAWQRLDALDDPAAFRSWFLRIVWRKAFDRRRALRGWLERFQPAPDTSQSAVEAVAVEPRPDMALLGRELERAVAQVVRSLPSRLRYPFLLACSGDHRYDDIAGLLGIPIGTVKWRVSEARRLIRVKLARLGFEVTR